MTQAGLGTQLRNLLELLDGDLERVYAEHLPSYRPRYTPIVRALLAEEPLTIGQISVVAGVSHSAASQTIAVMVREGWLVSATAKDERGREVRMSHKMRTILPVLAERWAATNAAAAELDREMSFPLSRALAEATALLREKRFADRIADQSELPDSRLPQPSQHASASTQPE